VITGLLLSINVHADISSGLVAHYPFEGDASDIQGGNNGNPQGEVSFNTTGVLRKAASFDGVDDYITIPNNPAFNGNEFSVSVWIRPHSHDGVLEGVVAHGEADNDHSHYTLGVLNNKFYFGIEDSSDINYNATAGVNLVNNRWTHVTGVRKSSGELEIYINGLLSGTIATPNPATIDVPLYIGALRNPGGGFQWPFDGDVDELRIYNRALTSSDIQELYNLDAPAPDITSGLVAHYEFEDNAVDTTGNGNDGTEVGGIQYAAGRIGKAASFNGTTSYITTNYTPYQNLDGDFTISAWVNWAGLSGQLSQRIIAKWSEADVGNQEYLFYLAESAASGALTINYAGQPNHISNYIPPSNEWVLVTAISENQTLKLYANTNLVYSAANTNTYSGDSEPLIIGAGGSSNPLPVYVFNGLMDDVRIYNRALSSIDVAYLHDPNIARDIGLSAHYEFENNVLDTSGSTNDLLNPGCESYDQGVFGSQATTFNGNCALTVPSGVVPSEGSVSLWFNPDTLDTSDQVDNTSYMFSHFQLGVIPESRAYIWHKNGELGFSASDQAEIYTGEILTVGSYHHIALTWTNDTVKGYLNGVEVVSQSKSTTTGLGQAFIGGYDNKDYSKGKIDDVRIYNRVLSSEEVQQLMLPTELYAADDVINVSEGVSRTFDPRINDSDPNGEAISIMGTSTPANGTVIYTSTSVTYTPGLGFTGADSFTYTIQNISGDTSTATINIIVNTIEDIPRDGLKFVSTPGGFVPEGFQHAKGIYFSLYDKRPFLNDVRGLSDSVINGNPSYYFSGVPSGFSLIEHYGAVSDRSNPLLESYYSSVYDSAEYQTIQLAELTVGTVSAFYPPTTTGGFGILTAASGTSLAMNAMGFETSLVDKAITVFDPIALVSDYALTSLDRSFDLITDLTACGIAPSAACYHAVINVPQNLTTYSSVRPKFSIGRRDVRADNYFYELPGFMLDRVDVHVIPVGGNTCPAVWKNDVLTLKNWYAPGENAHFPNSDSNMDKYIGGIIDASEEVWLPHDKFLEFYLAEPIRFHCVGDYRIQLRHFNGGSNDLLAEVEVSVGNVLTPPIADFGMEVDIAGTGMSSFNAFNPASLASGVLEFNSSNDNQEWKIVERVIDNDSMSSSVLLTGTGASIDVSNLPEDKFYTLTANAELKTALHTLPYYLNVDFRVADGRPYVTDSQDITGTTLTETFAFDDPISKFNTIHSRQSFIDPDPPVITVNNPESVTDVDALDDSGTPKSNSVISDFLSNVTAWDVVDNNYVDVSNDAPNVLPIGTTTVTFTAFDNWENKAIATADVTVSDNTPPFINDAGREYVDAASALGTPKSVQEIQDWLALFVATDNVDATVTVSNNAPDIFAFNPAVVGGTYTDVTFTATDAAGNTSNVIASLVVRDESPPIVTAISFLGPINVDTRAGLLSSDPAFSSLFSSASASDIVDGTITAITNNAPTSFTELITTVTFSATDSAGNTGTFDSGVWIMLVDSDGDTILDGDDPRPNTFDDLDGDVAPRGAPDGSINAGDYLIMQRFALGELAPTELDLSHGDIFPPGAPDGIINVQDLIIHWQLLQ